MKKGDKILTQRCGSLVVKFSSLDEAKLAGFEPWFNIYDDMDIKIGYAVTGNSDAAGWSEVCIAMA